MNYYELIVAARESLQDTIHTIDLLVEEGVFTADLSSALAEMKSALETMEPVEEDLKGWDFEFSGRDRINFEKVFGRT